VEIKTTEHGKKKANYREGHGLSMKENVKGQNT
jgi:hypothetical protein